MSTTISFEGWFQARFATDPDDTDDARGKNGWTFAFSGEPDFDRVIRFQNPVAPRSHGPVADVRVTGVSVQGAAIAAHPLVGAPVILNDGPKFEGHNGDIAPDGQEPVFPLHIVITQGGVRLEVTEWLAFADLRRPVSRPRFGRGVSQLTTGDLARLLGGLSPANYRAHRQAALQADLANEADPTRASNLRERLAQLPATDIRLGALAFKVDYHFPVPANSCAATDPANTLGVANPATQPWNLRWWMGCWDADALSGYIAGALSIG
jgi:hypothetical protein